MNACRLTLFGIICAVSMVCAGEWTGLRSGVLHIRANGPAAIAVRWAAVWAADGHDECLYLQRQDGSLLRRIAIAASSGDGRTGVALPSAGDYFLSIPGYSFRAYTVTAPDGCGLLFEPAVHHPSIQTSRPMQWHFRIDAPGSFALHAKDHGGARSVRLSGPDGRTWELILRNVKTVMYREHDSLIVRDAPVGDWKVDVDGPAKTAIWLTGCPNLFASAEEPLWRPHTDTGAALITISRTVSGITPRLGGLLPERELPRFAYDTLLAMGIRSGTYYLQQSRHGDSLNVRFSRWHRAYRNQLKIGISHGILQTSPQLISRVDTSALPYLRVLAARESGDSFFVAIADEPNTLMSTPAVFLPRAAAVAAAEKKRPFLAFPESAGFLNGPMAADAAKRRGRDWAESLLSIYGSAVGALTWHEWNIRDLPATEYYRRSIDSAWALSRRHPGGATRKLMITQTNIACGGDFSPAQQEGFYAALWYASVIAQCAASGKLSMLGWFPAIDDHHHVKGLMNWDGIKLRVKPVGRAAALAGAHILPCALKSASGAFEVDAAASRSTGGDSIALLIVNKGSRVQRTTLDVDLPAAWGNAAIRMRITRLTESGVSQPDTHDGMRAELQTMQMNLPPSSITGVMLTRRQ